MKGLSLFHTEDVLERADGAFNGGSFGIQRSPLVGAAQDPFSLPLNSKLV